MVGTPDAAVQSRTGGNPSPVAFPARQNGRYDPTIGVASAGSFKSDAAFGKHYRPELKSSGPVAYWMKTL